MEKQALTLARIRQLAKKMQAAGLHELELRNEVWSLRMRYPERVSPSTTATVVVEQLLTPLRAPMLGKVLLSHPCQRTAYVQPGQEVKHNDLLALLKIGPLYLPLRSPANGRVVSIEVQPDQIVEFGSEIVLLETADALPVAL